MQGLFAGGRRVDVYCASSWVAECKFRKSNPKGSFRTGTLSKGAFSVKCPWTVRASVLEGGVCWMVHSFTTRAARVFAAGDCLNEGEGGIMNPLLKLRSLGQSIWLDYISRGGDERDLLPLGKELWPGAAL